MNNSWIFLQNTILDDRFELFVNCITNKKMELPKIASGMIQRHNSSHINRILHCQIMFLKAGTMGIGEFTLDT